MGPEEAMQTLSLLSLVLLIPPCLFYCTVTRSTRSVLAAVPNNDCGKCGSPGLRPHPLTIFFLSPRCDLKAVTAPARWLSWWEHHPVHQKLEGSIVHQGTYLGCGFYPWLRHVREATG